MTFVLKIYYKELFIGYVKSYRKYRNLKYRFCKTKNINKAITYKSKDDLLNLMNKLITNMDNLYYNDFYQFEMITITNQEIRKSKLNMLNIVKPKSKIFKK